MTAGDAGNARRCKHDILKQLQRVRAATGSDGSHVPDHGSLSVKIGGENEQASTFAVFGCNLVQDRWRDEALDHIAQRRGFQQARAEQAGSASQLDPVVALSKG